MFLKQLLYLIILYIYIVIFQNNSKKININKLKQ